MRCFQLHARSPTERIVLALGTSEGPAHLAAFSPGACLQRWSAVRRLGAGARRQWPGSHGAPALGSPWWLPGVFPPKNTVGAVTRSNPMALDASEFAGTCPDKDPPR